jgi:4-hydroxybenzoate polyprenyltransferase
VGRILFKLNKFAGGVARLAALVVYPTMKRLTSWPQVATSQLGALVATPRSPERSPGPRSRSTRRRRLTMVYDTIYAMQDQRDDAVVGVRSTARRFARPRGG